MIDKFIFISTTGIRLFEVFRCCQNLPYIVEQDN